MKLKIINTRESVNQLGDEVVMVDYEIFDDDGVVQEDGCGYMFPANVTDKEIDAKFTEIISKKKAISDRKKQTKQKGEKEKEHKHFLNKEYIT